MSIGLVLDAGSEHALGSLAASISASPDRSASSLVLIGPAFIRPDTPLTFFSGRQRQVNLLVPLSRKAVRDMDELRFRNKEHDIFIVVDVHGTRIMIQAATKREDPREPDLVVFRSTGTPIEQRFDLTHIERIPSSDWVNRFLPIFGYGRSLLVELPVSIEELKETVRRIESQALGKRLVEAANALERSEQLQRSGEWRSSVWATREALESLQRGSLETGASVQAAIKDTIVNSGLPDAGAVAVTSTIDQLHSFASSAHPVPKGGKEVKIGIFEKEDSQMIFGSTALVINLIAKKLMKPANI
jgi:AcrR family transcriptional regulator